MEMGDKEQKRARWNWTPATIILTYLIVSGAWILFSDNLLAVFVPDPQSYAKYQTYKGWFFVTVTTLLLYGLIQRHTRKLQSAQERLRESEAWYRRLITTAEEGIWALDTEHKVTFVNQRFSEMLGYREEEMLDRPIFDFIDPEWDADMARHLESRDHGVKEEFETCLIGKDGATHWVIASSSPIFDKQGSITGSFSMLTDISERRRLEDFQREFARKTIEAATEGKLLIRAHDEIMNMAGPPLLSRKITAPEDLEGARGTVTDIVHGYGMAGERADDFILCISEAATNAVKHAGGGLLTLHHIDGKLLAVVSDKGPGILAINLPEVALKYGYSTAVSMGMGYKAMISMADKIYLATGPGGSTVAIEKAINPPEPPPVAIPERLGEW